MNPPAGYEYPEVGEVISKEFVVDNKGEWKPVSISIGLKIHTWDFGGWARPKNRHWNVAYPKVKRPEGFRFLDDGEIIKKGDQFIDTSTNHIEFIGNFSFGDKVDLRHFPIIRSINKITNPKKKTALQLANEKVASLTKELEDLKDKVKGFAAGL
jgi:hypothetical protein